MTMTTTDLVIQCTDCDGTPTPGEYKGDDVSRCECGQIKLRRYQ
jgi:hypothetical protein